MSNNSIFDYQLNILASEIEKIGNIILHFDHISFRIKGLAATAWAIIIGWGAQAGKVKLIVVSIPVLLVLWLLDAQFKSYQKRSMARMAYIEEFINNIGKFKNNGLKEAFQKQTFGQFIIHDPIGRWSYRTDKEFMKNYKSLIKFWRCFWTKEICIFFLTLFICSILAIVLVGRHIIF